MSLCNGGVTGWIRHCKSGTNYTPAATSSRLEFRIGSCEKSSATQTTKPKLFQEDLVVMPPQVEQMGELANQRSFFSFISNVYTDSTGEQESTLEGLLVFIFATGSPL